MRPYHPNNLTLLPYAHWRVKALAWAGTLLGVTFHIQGIPLGASPKETVNGQSNAGREEGRVAPQVGAASVVRPTEGNA
jgi:hypothetical protein